MSLVLFLRGDLLSKPFDQFSVAEVLERPISQLLDLHGFLRSTPHMIENPESRGPAFVESGCPHGGRPAKTAVLSLHRDQDERNGDASQSDSGGGWDHAHVRNLRGRRCAATWEDA